MDVRSDWTAELSLGSGSGRAGRAGTRASGQIDTGAWRKLAAYPSQARQKGHPLVSVDQCHIVLTLATLEVRRGGGCRLQRTLGGEPPGVAEGQQVSQESRTEPPRRRVPRFAVAFQSVAAPPSSIAFRGVTGWKKG